MLGLDIVDVCTLLIYLAGITVVGLWMGKTVHDTTDYFVAGRRFGKLFATFHAFGTGTHSDQAVSVAAKTYTAGMSGIWYQWLWLFVTPFYWLIFPLLRRCRAITTGDYFQARYGRSVAMLFVIVGILNLMVNIGTILRGSGAVIRAATGDTVNENLAIAAMTVLFVTYGVVGGFSAAVVTDFFQGLLTIVFSFLLLPFALHQVGGFAGLHEKVALYAPDPAAMWSLVAPGEIGFYYILMIALNGLVGIVVQPHIVPGSNAIRSEQAAQLGHVAGNLIKRVCTVAWVLLGMCAFVMYPHLIDKADIDQSFGRIARDLLPDILPGLVGIFLASLLASIMSSCDSFMMTCSALFTHNIYRPLIAPNRSEKHYINVGRAAAIVTVAGGVGFAYQFESVLQGLELFWKISAMMGIAFWFGLFWRRATTAGAWASTLTAFGILYITSQPMFVEWAHKTMPFLFFAPDAEAVYLPTQMLLYLGAGTAAMIAVSLLTQPPATDKLDRFYEVVRTPVQPGEVIQQPFTLPANVEPAAQRKLIPHRDWEIQRPNARGLIGFAVVWLIVGGLIGSVAWIVRIGA